MQAGVEWDGGSDRLYGRLRTSSADHDKLILAIQLGLDDRQALSKPNSRREKH